MRLSIQGKIIIITVIILFLALGTSTFVNLFHYQKNCKQLLQTKVVVVGKNLRYILEQTLALELNLDELPGVDTKCQTIVDRYKEICYCYVIDSEMRVLYHNDSSYINKIIKYPLDEKTALTEEAFIRFSLFEGNKFYEIFLPIFKEKEQLGEIRLGIPVQIINAEVNHIIIDSILVTLGAFYFAVLLSFFLAQSITKPIRKLHLGAEIIEKGNLDYKVEIKSKDEIGQLAKAFNGMVDKLKESQTNLEEKSKELAKTLQRVTQEKDKINTILQSIADGVFVIDVDYKITMFSQTAADISGFTAKEVIGKKYDKVLQFILEKDEKMNDKFIIEAIRTGKMTEMTNHTVLIKKDGSRLPVADSATSLKDKKGNVVGCVVIFRDMTREREIDRMKSEFVSFASHQLRTPLTSIKWYSELLLQKKAGKLTEKQKRYLGEIYHGNQRMVNLINALLNVSSIEMGTLAISPKPTDIGKLLNEVIKEQESLIEKKKLQVIVHKPEKLPEISVDPKLVRIVFQNLLSDAAEYTPSKGKITCTIKIKGDEILFKVQDTGIGIPKGQQKKIFQKLFRADNAVKQNPEGTGLGLYITKAVVEASGGKIWFESKEGQGTTFWVALSLKGSKARPGAKRLIEII